MNLKYYLVLLTACLLFPVSAQTLEQAKEMLEKGEYEKAKPVFERFVKSQPANGNYNLWYGICCLNSGEAGNAILPLETAVKKRIPSGQLYLGQAYNVTYRFDEAVSTFEAYIKDLIRLKRPVEEANNLLEHSKTGLRMLKGVEEVCVIDSFVVDKEGFLANYHLSRETGSLHMFNAFFNQPTRHEGTVYETELGNKAYYGNMDENGVMNIYSRLRLIDGWNKNSEIKLPENINTGADSNYPFVLTDGITIYYAAKGAHSLGGYDIFVTRFNSATENYLAPENIGMPFNSPYNDYMFAIDEFNNLGWFASDRYQPEEKVCIYVFIPNASKIAYDYETIEPQKLRNLAMLNAIEDTWKDETVVAEAGERLKHALTEAETEHKVYDFEFAVNDQHTYHSLSDFKSDQAKKQFQQYQLLKKDYNLLLDKLNTLREEYTRANTSGKSKAAPPILDLEQRLKVMYEQILMAETGIRNEEITHLNK